MINACLALKLLVGNLVSYLNACMNCSVCICTSDFVIVENCYCSTECLV